LTCLNSLYKIIGMKIRKYLLSITIFFFCGCEDDAILEPQVEQEEQGSYGNLSLPNEENIKTENPKIF